MAGSRLSEPSGVDGDGEREHAVVDEEDMGVRREVLSWSACGNEPNKRLNAYYKS